MKLKVGCEFRTTFPQATPAFLMLNIHYSRASDLTAPDHIIVTPPVPMKAYWDTFGNGISPWVHFVAVVTFHRFPFAEARPVGRGPMGGGGGTHGCRRGQTQPRTRWRRYALLHP